MQKFLINCWDNVFKILAYKNNYFQNIEICENIIEFKDGFYFLNENIFLSFLEKRGKFMTTLCSSNHFNIFFDQAKNFKPYKWLSFLQENLDQKNIVTFCYNLGSVFNSSFWLVR